MTNSAQYRYNDYARNDISACRVCGAVFFPSPLLVYTNMPKAAQFMPDKDSLSGEGGVDLEVCQCSGCGLVQLSSLPVPYYREVVRSAAFSAEIKSFRQLQFADFVRKYSLSGRKVLEVGSGRGEYLELMRDTGVFANGLEYSEDAVTCCANAGLTVFQGFIDSCSYEIPEAPYDAFYTLNFLEHMPDPNAMLRGMWRNLAETAVGLVEVPNFDMICRKNMFSEFIGDHLLYFTAETLASSLVLNGYEVLECRPVWYDYIISAVVRKRCRLDVTGFGEFQSNLAKEVNDHFERFGDRNVAIWGAGHQALAIMSLLNLGKRVKYVVDSATFKQGLYTPATHIPIVSPEALLSDPVDSVIVMAASYSDEVAGIILNKYNRNMDVSILRDYGLESVKQRFDNDILPGEFK